MTNLVFVHQLQAVDKTVGNVSLDNVADHNIRDRCCRGRFPGKDEAPHAITFGKNADDRPMLHDDQKTDVLVGHELHCRKRGVPGTDSPQSLGFGGKDLFKWPVGKDLFGTSKRMVHDASPVRLYEHGLHAEAVKRKAQRGLIYVKPVAVRLLCAATEPRRSSAKNALQGRMAGGRIDLLATLLVGGTYGKPVLAKRFLRLS
jgi:hypothetical protein